MEYEATCISDIDSRAFRVRFPWSRYHWDCPVCGFKAKSREAGAIVTAFNVHDVLFGCELDERSGVEALALFDFDEEEEEED